MRIKPTLREAAKKLRNKNFLKPYKVQKIAEMATKLEGVWDKALVPI